MVYRIMISAGLFALGYYLGREVGRTESIREQLRHARETGTSVNMGDAMVIDMERTASTNGETPRRH